MASRWESTSVIVTTGATGTPVSAAKAPHASRPSGPVSMRSSAITSTGKRAPSTSVRSSATASNFVAPVVSTSSTSAMRAPAAGRCPTSTDAASAFADASSPCVLRSLRSKR